MSMENNPKNDMSCPPASVQTKFDILELDGKLERMIDGINTVKERQAEMQDDITKIKEAVYNPDEGIYARLREIEAWKSTHSRLMWLLLTCATAIFGTAILTYIE